MLYLICFQFRVCPTQSVTHKMTSKAAARLFFTKQISDYQIWKTELLYSWIKHVTRHFCTYFVICNASGGTCWGNEQQWSSISCFGLQDALWTAVRPQTTCSFNLLGLLSQEGSHRLKTPLRGEGWSEHPVMQFTLLVKYAQRKCTAFSFNLETFTTLWWQVKNNSSLCHHRDRNVWNYLLAATHFNQQGRVWNWEFNNLIITIIDCDTYSDDRLQNEWITDLLVCIEFMKRFLRNNLAAHQPQKWFTAGRAWHCDFRNERCWQHANGKSWPGWLLINTGARCLWSLSYKESKQSLTQHRYQVWICSSINTCTVCA